MSADRDPQTTAKGYRGAASLVGLAWRELERDHPEAAKDGANAPFRAALTRMRRAERALLDAARDAERQEATNG